MKKLLTFVLFFFFTFSLLLYASSSAKSFNSLIYNQETLTEQLKGKTEEEVVNVLRDPAVKKPREERKEDLQYWWYHFPEAGFLYISKTAGFII